LDKKRQTQETLFSNACFASGSLANPIIFARSARFPLPQIMRLPASFLQVGSRVELIVREEANRGTPHTITENGAFPPPPSPPQHGRRPLSMSSTSLLASLVHFGIREDSVIGKDMMGHAYRNSAILGGAGSDFLTGARPRPSLFKIR